MLGQFIDIAVLIIRWVTEGDADDLVIQPSLIQNHAAFLHLLSDGALVCAWFGGTLEGKSDISIFAAVLLVAFLFGCLDGLGAAGMQMDAFAFLPLFDKGLAWLMPTLLACVVGVMVRPTEMAAEAA